MDKHGFSVGGAAKSIPSVTCGAVGFRYVDHNGSVIPFRVERARRLLASRFLRKLRESFRSWRPGSQLWMMTRKP